MKNKKWILPAALLLGALLIFSLAHGRRKDQLPPEGIMTVETGPGQQEASQPLPDHSEPALPEPTETQPEPSPDFTVFDGEGNAVSLSDLRGKPVIINFWATWCGYCVREMPDFQKVYEEFGDEIHFMMINVTDGFQETREGASEFVAEKGFTFPVYYDLELSAANTYGVNAMPVTYLLDEEGCFVAWQQGMLDETVLRMGVDMLLESNE